MAVTLVFAGLILAGFLTGIHLMQSPKTALWGNRLGALSMALAVIWAFLSFGEGSSGLFSALIFAAIGGAAGIALGQAVKMIHMPQTVALLNGLGGAASALVAWAAVLAYTGQRAAVLSQTAVPEAMMLFWATAGLAVGVGALTLGGSFIAAVKLQGLAFQRPFQVAGHGHILRFMLLVCAFFIVLNVALAGHNVNIIVPLIALLGLFSGMFMALRIGGADMPIIISLLNSLSGIAASVTGLAVENLILVGTGALVGVAGLILTRIMCRAMNRSLVAVLAGFTPRVRPQVIVGDGVQGEEKIYGQEVVEKAVESCEGTEGRTGEPLAPEAEIDHGDTAVDETVGEPGAGQEAEKAPEEGRLSEADLPTLLQQAARVIIVPGYGMAVAQAQQAVRQLVDALERRGKEVKIAIHPVAGRMPGHMNVLLAEAGIDYEKLLDLDTVNPQFDFADLAVVVGACDVVNPSANSVEGTPISGMPILNVEKAKQVIVCNLDENPGYSGVDNILYSQPHVVTLWGDAAQTVPRLTAILEENATPVD